MALSGAYRLVYYTPEKIFHESSYTQRFKQFEALVNAQKLAFFAVDEAHCVVEDTYREQYRHLDYLVSQLQVHDGPVAPMVALTATAPPEMARRIVRALKLRSQLELRTPVHRSNLVLRRIEATGSMKDEVAHVVGQLRAGTDGDPGPTIVYVRTCNDAEKWCELLQARLPSLKEKIRAFYSGKAAKAGSLSATQKRRVQDDFNSGAVRIVVATTAFGMGVNKQDVRNVVIKGGCFSLLRFMQEGGRAGRDDADATVTLVGSTGAFLPFGGDALSGSDEALRRARGLDEITEWFYDGHRCLWRGVS